MQYLVYIQQHLFPSNLTSVKPLKSQPTGELNFKEIKSQPTGELNFKEMSIN